MSTGHRLRHNILALSVLQVSNYAVPLITVPYLVRVLHADGYGRLAFAQALIVVFDLIANYGFDLSATRGIARCRHAPDEVSRRFCLTISAKILLTALCAMTLAILVVFIPRLRAAPGLYAAAFLTVLGTTAFPVWYFQGIEEMRYIAAAHCIARLMTIPALLLWVRSAGDLATAAAVQGSVSLVAAILVLPVLLRKLPHRFEWPSAQQTAQVLRGGWHAFVSSAASGVNAAATILVLGLVAGSAEVGYYSAADKVIRSVSAAVNPVSQAIYPHLTAMAAASQAAAAGFIRKSLGWVAVFSGAVSLAVFLFAPLAGLMIWGPGFAESVTVLRCLAPLPILLALVNGIGIQVLLVFGLDSLVSRSSVVCVSLNALLTAVLGTLLGATGAAAAAVASLALTLLYIAMNLRRRQFIIWRTERAAPLGADASCL